GPLGIGAAVTFVKDVNHAEAHIGSSAEVTAYGDLKVNAKAEDNFHAAAIGVGKTKSKVAIGGAVSYVQTTNESFASVDDDAVVNAGGNLSVSAEATKPLGFEVLDDYQLVHDYILGLHQRSEDHSQGARSGDNSLGNNVGTAETIGDFLTE